MLEELAKDYKNTLRKYSWKGLEDYTDISQKYPPADVFVQVMGMSPQKQPKYADRDWSVAMDIVDPTIPIVHGKQTYYTCVFFRRNKADLPKVEIGHYILLRKASIQVWKNRPQLKSGPDSPFQVLSNVGEYDRSKDFFIQTEDEEIYQSFKAWRSAKEKLTINSFGGSGAILKGRPTLSTEELMQKRQYQYFNYVGMVVGCWEKVKNTRTIKLTDFTVNPYPYTQEDGTGENGVVGIVTPGLMLQCTLWDNHADNCPELRYGDYVHLENCVRNRNEPEKSYLEISIRGNTRSNPHVVKIHENDSSLKALLERKKELEDAIAREKSPNIELITSPIRTRVTDLKALISIKELIEKEDAGIEYIRATVQKYRPLDITSWLRDFCKSCKKTFASTIAEQCSLCGNLLKPVYKAGFVLQDEKESQLVAWVFDEAADKLFEEYPAQRLKDDPSLWEQFEKYVILAQHEKIKPYFDFGIKKYYTASDSFSDGWSYSIVNTEFVLEDD